MAGLPDTSKNTMLASIFSAGSAGSGKALYAAAHTADPGTTGANEGSTTRQAITWAAPSAGAVAGGTVNIPCPAGTFGFVGYWDALTAGNFVGGYALNGTVTFASAQTLPVVLNESVA